MSETNGHNGNSREETGIALHRQVAERPLETAALTTAALTAVKTAALPPAYWPPRSAVGAYNLAALLDIAARRKWIMLLAAGLVLGAAGAYIGLAPRQFEAELKLMIKRSRLETADAAGAAKLAEVGEPEIAAEIELIRNTELMEKVVEMCRLTPLEGLSRSEKRQRIALATRELRNQLKVLPIGKTNLISMKYSAPEPERAANVLNTLANLYLEKHMAVHRNRDTSEFFRNQTEFYEKELVSAQAQLGRFRQHYEVSLLDLQKQNNLRRIAELEAALQESEAQIRDAQDRVATLRTQRSALPANIETQSRIAASAGLQDRLKGQLIDFENRRTELLTKYEPGYRLVTEVERQIQDTQAALERERNPTVVDRTEALNPLRQSVESDLLHTETVAAGLAARGANLTRELATHRARQLNLEKITNEHDDIQRRVKLAEENYLLYQKKKEESRLADALDEQRILNVAIVETAVPPALPKDRHRSFVLMLGLVMALFAGAGSAIAAEFLGQQRQGGAQQEGMPPVRPEMVAPWAITAGASPPQTAVSEWQDRQRMQTAAVGEEFLRETREIVREIRSSYSQNRSG